MRPSSSIVYRVASEPWELEQIYRLNRATFAGEIPQHQVEGDLLVDRYDAENSYVVAVEGGRVLGMLAVRDRRPFSLDQKLPNLDDYLPAGAASTAGALCELRLLAIEKDRRNGVLLPGLLRCLWELGSGRGYQIALLAAYAPRVPLYERLGCVAFGPRVGTPEVPFQPMMALKESFEEAFRRYATRRRNGASAPAPAPRSFLPGPVELDPATCAAFAARPVSHRSAPFHDRLAEVKERLLALTRAPGVQILIGSGTLANDGVAAQLSLLPGRGVVLVNGEFGNRLADHARRHRLAHEVVAVPWGAELTLATLEEALSVDPPPAWLWMTHCETSTGVINHLAGARERCAARGTRVCADCISTLGSIPVDLDGIYLATGVSGKALRSYPGLSLVFHDHDLAPQPERLPRYLDLGLYAACGGVPFTHSSNLIAALAAALAAPLTAETFAERRATGVWLRGELRARGYSLVAAEEISAPGITSIALPAGRSSRQVGDRLAARGFLLSYESDYLLARNWIQICTFGGVGRHDLEALLAVLGEGGASREGPPRGAADQRQEALRGV